MGKKVIRYSLIILMMSAIIVTIVFIFKSKETKNEYKTTVSYDKNSTKNQSSYTEPRKEETLIEYAQDNYLPIILFSSASFVILLAFYGFLSKKKEW